MSHAARPAGDAYRRLTEHARRVATQRALRNALTDAMRQLSLAAAGRLVPRLVQSHLAAGVSRLVIAVARSGAVLHHARSPAARRMAVR